MQKRRAPAIMAAVASVAAVVAYCVMPPRAFPDRLAFIPEEMTIIDNKFYDLPQWAAQWHTPDAALNTLGHMNSARVPYFDDAWRRELGGTNGSFLDVGCGIGGSSRHMARRFAGARASCVGLTLSPEQARRGNELSRDAGLDVTLEAQDATNTTFADGSFDLVWSMESGEHMPDKATFVAELGRLCAPGGRVSVVTWCHRDLQRGRKLSVAERAVLGLINYCYYLPKWCSGADYARLFAAQRGVTARGVRDWTANIAPFWPAVARSSLKWSSLKKLRKTGLKTIRGAVAILFMILGYKLGTVKFVAVAAAKDEAPGDAKWAWSGPVF